MKPSHAGPACAQELYGNTDAGNLLSAFSRLFTNYLQSIHGFSCGVDDMLLTATAEAARHAKLAEANTAAHRSAGLFKIS